MMWRRVWLLMFCLLGTPAWCEESIVDVLRRSQDLRLQTLPLAAAGSDRAATLQRSFDTVLQALPSAPTVELRVIRGPVVAETLHGHIVAVNERVAEMPESVQLFIVAHELGHVVQQHWRQTGLLYQKWVPGAVTPERTDPIANLLGREASALAHAHEFAADAFAARVLQGLGRDIGDVAMVFREFGTTQDTVTHPGTRKRLAMLRALMAAPH
jgi:Zn-dependent protease with chaperone function